MKLNDFDEFLPNLELISKVSIYAAGFKELIVQFTQADFNIRNEARTK